MAVSDGEVLALYLPTNYVAAASITVKVRGVMATATSGNVQLRASIERDDVNGIDIDADSFGSTASDQQAAPATSGLIFEHSFTLSGGALDSVAAGDLFRLKIERIAASVSEASGQYQAMAMILTS